jgi:hypothetical protein
MKLLRFRKLANGNIRLVILLDNTKTDEAGEPDEAWVYVLTWPPKPDSVTAANYRDQIKQESKLLAQLELTKRQGEDEGTAVPGGGEGTDL